MQRGSIDQAGGYDEGRVKFQEMVKNYTEMEEEWPFELCEQMFYSNSCYTDLA